MKRDNRKRGHLRRGLVATMLTIMIGLFTIGCGEVVSIDGIDTGGGTNSLKLSWNPPTTNEDGTPLEDLAGYKLYYGTQPGQYSKVITMGGTTSVEVDNMSSGTYFLTVTAFDIYGNESGFSNEIYHTF